MSYKAAMSSWTQCCGFPGTLTLSWSVRLVRAQECPRPELTSGAADQDPTDRCLLAGVMPERHARGDVELAPAAPCQPMTVTRCQRLRFPEGMSAKLQGCVRVSQALEQRRLTRPGYTRVEAQLADHSQVTSGQTEKLGSGRLDTGRRASPGIRRLVAP